MTTFLAKPHIRNMFYMLCLHIIFYQIRLKYLGPYPISDMISSVTWGGV